MMTLVVARDSWTERLDEFAVLEMLRHRRIPKIGPGGYFIGGRKSK
jgi:hypothetical protein